MWESGGSLLPGCCMPVLVEAAERALRYSEEDGRLAFEPQREFDFLNDMAGIACLAAVLVSEHPDNPLRGNDRLADLVGRAGRFLLHHHLDRQKNPPGRMWYEDREVHEWVYEMWLTAYRLLRERGAGELTTDWEEGLNAGAGTFHRWLREIEHLRTASSPNLLISPNHFAFFILNTLEAGQVLGVDEYHQLGLERALWFAAQQKSDGYWEETDGPTTHYNFISTAAVGWYYALTGRRIFREAVRRVLDFHTRFTYPDGVFLETIDQRVRYRPGSYDEWVWTLQAFSNFPEGRALNEFIVRRSRCFRPRWWSGHLLGRLAKGLLRYRTGPVPPLGEEFERGAFALELPGGIFKDGTWAVGLCGIPSRPRSHRYTLDRQNLLSVWHRRTGLIVGGGNSRNHPHAATFHKLIHLDPQAIADGITQQEVYIPVRASLRLTERSGALTLGYWGFDAELTAEILDSRRLRITAAAWGRKQIMPILLTLNLRLLPSLPLRTATGGERTVDGSPFQLTAEQMGEWIGQGGWRISLPVGSSLSYPFRPYYPNLQPHQLPPDLLYALLTVPLTNERVALEVRIE